jgi:hypothetical protein
MGRGTESFRSFRTFRGRRQDLFSALIPHSCSLAFDCPLCCPGWASHSCSLAFDCPLCCPGWPLFGPDPPFMQSSLRLPAMLPWVGFPFMQSSLRLPAMLPWMAFGWASHSCSLAFDCPLCCPQLPRLPAMLPAVQGSHSCSLAFDCPALIPCPDRIPTGQDPEPRPQDGPRS